MPHQHVGIAHGAVDIRHEGIEPHNRGRELSIRSIDDRVERGCTGKIIERKVGAPLARISA
jgi:hypothetical protein